MRTGSEPSQARSPLRMRLVLAVFGLLSAIAGIAVFAAAREPGWELGFAALGVVALVNAFVVVRHIRQGPHYQPGRDVPPYRPVESGHDPGAGDGRPERRPPTLEARKRWYFLLMGVCLSLFVLAWAWVRLFSPTAAVVMSIVASVIPPIAAIVGNAGSPTNRRSGR